MEGRCCSICRCKFIYFWKYNSINLLVLHSFQIVISRKLACCPQFCQRRIQFVAILWKLQFSGTKSTLCPSQRFKYLNNLIYFGSAVYESNDTWTERDNVFIYLPSQIKINLCDCTKFVYFIYLYYCKGLF